MVIIAQVFSWNKEEKYKKMSQIFGRTQHVVVDGPKGNKFQFVAVLDTAPKGPL
jgi:hypothetical protein